MDIVWNRVGTSYRGNRYLKPFFVKKFLFTSTLLYVVMGWLIVFVWNDLVAQSCTQPGLVLINDWRNVLYGRSHFLYVENYLSTTTQFGMYLF